MHAAFLGIDVGTSALKALLMDERGGVVGSASEAYPIDQPRPGWSQQDPRSWWAAAERAIRVLVAGYPGFRVRGVGLSGQMHGLVLVPSSDGPEIPEPTHPALLWNDQRTANECREIEEKIGKRRLIEITGNAALPGFTLPKILWIRRHEPEAWRRAACVMLPKDYVRLGLTGERATDVGDGSGLLLMDVDARTISHELLSAFDLEPSKFPRVMESGSIAGRVTGWAAERTGLEAGIPVVAGSGDNQAGGVGAGIIEPGQVLATLGTSGVIYAHAERPRRDLGGERFGRLHTMGAATGDDRAPGAWCVTGCMLSAGGALRWARDVIAPGVSFDSLMDEAGRVAPGCEGLTFLPYLTGERCPHPEPEARAGWIGLTSRHTRAHLIRAVVEGVSFGMGEILDLVRSIGVRVEHVRVGGGGARSALWRGILADVFGTAVHVPNTEEGPALGAAVLAGVGVGIWPSVASAAKVVVSDHEAAQPGDADRYTAARARYAKLFPAALVGASSA